VRPTCTVCTGPAAARPQRRTGLERCGPWDTASFALAATRAVAWLEAAHRRLTDDQAAQGCTLMLQGIAGHGVAQNARRGQTTSRSTRGVARGDGAPSGAGKGGQRLDGRGKVSTGRIHGP
jgi:hypothetical protein